jgi:hypothetical protein
VERHIIGALETGCRLVELLSLQWSQVRGDLRGFKSRHPDHFLQRLSATSDRGRFSFLSLASGGAILQRISFPCSWRVAQGLHREGRRGRERTSKYFESHPPFLCGGFLSRSCYAKLESAVSQTIRPNNG